MLRWDAWAELTNQANMGHWKSCKLETAARDKVATLFLGQNGTGIKAENVKGTEIGLKIWQVETKLTVELILSQGVTFQQDMFLRTCDRELHQCDLMKTGP